MTDLQTADRVRVIGHDGKPHHDAHPVGAILPVTDGCLPGGWQAHGAHHQCVPVLPAEEEAELRPRALVAAAYRLNCSPHEWTDEDSAAMARYVVAAARALDARP